MMNIDEIYQSLLESAKGYSMGVLWRHLEVDLKDMDISYETRKETFFLVLERMMKEGHLKLASEDIFLDGTIEEQLQLFKDIWPPYPSEDELDDLDDFGMWFLAKAPAGIVWFYPNGEEAWT